MYSRKFPLFFLTVSIKICRGSNTFSHKTLTLLLFTKKFYDKNLLGIQKTHRHTQILTTCYLCNHVNHLMHIKIASLPIPQILQQATVCHQLRYNVYRFLECTYGVQLEQVRVMYLLHDLCFLHKIIHFHRTYAQEMKIVTNVNSSTSLYVILKLHCNAVTM